MIKKKEKEPKNFENALEELEQLSEKNQGNSTSLEEMLEIFERGTYLSKYCKETLNDIDDKITLLVKENNIFKKKKIK